MALVIDMTWTATPAPIAGVIATCPAGLSAFAAVATATAAAPAPFAGTRVPAVRLRALTGGTPFGAGTATDELHAYEQSTKNDPSVGIHSPGRPLS
ncbi:hypothetical protein [Blastococcus sp. TF02A-26]|uniref:hypothetical protein n=1 Tax=Blastococcus sp. TF02A-26 TaxID=2250577 RepID=UPI000DE92A19|nr:hypothetical protein [Blastococcus sp. TF02A-26]RBY89757.1 hypothetical protein DQ240_02210 [Blastococcus sp. TF02A-26]